MSNSQPPLIAIVGPTASGKTSLAIDLAVRYGGEIICADSRTVYRGMDIGTAKPTGEDLERVVHWGLDLVDPGERFTVADFKLYAEGKIKEIRERGHVPLLVGGTGLYVDAVLFNFKFAPVHDESFRQQLNSMSVNELQKYCTEYNIRLPENKYNKRYLVRAIERKNTSITRERSLLDNCYVVGIATDREMLRTRIESRSEQLFTNGVVEEAITLGKKYGWENEAMTGNIYALVHKYIAGDMDERALRESFIVSDWRLAKRQLTWLRRNEYICWADLSSAEQYLSHNLVTRQGM